MSRMTYIAGNWKMNLLPDQGEVLVSELVGSLKNKKDLEVIVIPTTGLIPFAVDWTSNSSIQVGAQNCSDMLSGAYTGETSPGLLKILGCTYCLAGHSERRVLYGETNEFVGRKAQTLLTLNITPIVCVGESLEEREGNQHLDKISEQIRTTYDQIEKEKWGDLIFAYEPIWAIGTGKTATPEQADEIHLHIRREIENVAGKLVASSISILYGGSAKPSNAKELLSQENIDGLLVGGASLNAEDFGKMISAF